MKNKLTLKIIAILISTDFLETFAQFCFKKSVIGESGFQIFNFIDALAFAKIAVTSPFLWVGLLSVLAIFIIWSTVLSKIDLSVAVPVCSFSYILVPLTSVIFFHEKVTPLRWTGITVVLLGVILVTLSSKETQRA